MNTFMVKSKSLNRQGRSDPWQFICGVNLFHLFVMRQILKDIVHNFLKTISFLTVLSTIELQGKWTCCTFQGLELIQLKNL